MKSVKLLAAASVGLFASIAPAHAALIDFSGYTAGTTFSTPLSILGATFTSSTDTLKVINFGAGNSLCAFDGFTCSGTLSIAFDPGVAALSFSYSGDDVDGSEIRFEGEGPGLSFHGRLFADGNPATTGSSQLPFDDVSFLAVWSTAPNGIGLTTVGFASPEAAVPEPATWAMMIAGFGLIGAGMRRRAVKVTYQTA